MVKTAYRYNRNGKLICQQDGNGGEYQMCVDTVVKFDEVVIIRDKTWIEKA